MWGVSDTVNPDSIVPMYEQLAAILRRRIADGDITSKLPSKEALIGQYEVGIATVNRALDLLKDEDLIVFVPGKGLYVRPS